MGTLYRNIKLIIIICAAVLLVLIYPFQQIYITPYISKTGNGELIGTGNISNGKEVCQSFSGRYSYLQSISIYMQDLRDNRESGELVLRLYEEGEIFIKEFRIRLSKIKNYEWVDIPIGQKLEKGKTYTYSITTDVEEGNTLQIFKTTAENAPSENLKYQYNGISEKESLAVIYKYRENVQTVWEGIPYYFMVILPSAVLIELLQQKGKKGCKN